MSVRFEGLSADGTPTPSSDAPSDSHAGKNRNSAWAAVQLPAIPRVASKNYSRFVRAMKFILPVTALVLIGLVAFWPQLMREDRSFRLGFTDLSLSGVEDPSMVNVRYVGTDKEDRPFTVTADLARNLDTVGAVVGLESPKADVLMQDGTWLLLSAKSGTYSRDKKLLELSKRVNLFHDSGYEFHTEQAIIDLAASVAEGNLPIKGQGAFGDLSAAGFKITDQGRTLYFKGPARAVLHRGEK